MLGQTYSPVPSDSLNTESRNIVNGGSPPLTMVESER